MPVASPPASANAVKELRSACAASGFHEHDGCSCSDEELIRRASSPPVASPPASVEGIARAVDAVKFTIAQGVPARGWRAHWQTLLDERAALLSDRAAMAERVAGLERERDDARYELSRFKDAISKRPDYEMHWEEASARAEASDAEVARLREALEKAGTFAGQTGGTCLGLAMSGRKHPDPDGALMGLFHAAQELTTAIQAALTRPDEPTKET